MIRSDALQCERIVRRHARTFTLASYFLPARKRRAAFAFYAFCREADDIVDSAESSDKKTVARQLQCHRRDLVEALDARPRGPVFREVLWAVREFSIPGEIMFELLDGVARDLEPGMYDTWDDLERYCEGVASTVGVMCAHVFGVPGGRRQLDIAIGHARTLGVAMQLTNILRDVREDARNGRVYLPQDELDFFGVDRAALSAATMHDPLRRLLAFEARRAYDEYDRGRALVALVDPAGRPMLRAITGIYRALLDEIVGRDYDVLRDRARVPSWRKAWIVWRSYAGREPGAVSRRPTP